MTSQVHAFFWSERKKGEEKRGIVFVLVEVEDCAPL